MRDIEFMFLLAVERGQTDILKNLLHHKELNINCCDPLNRSALIIAIDTRNLDTLSLLLETEIQVGDALLYAIQEEFVEAVELLLERHPDQVHHHNHHHQYLFDSDVSPLMLAAQRNNVEIVKLLLDRDVEPIQQPHDPRCGCSVCCHARNRDCLRHSRSRINAYRALASPSLMALSSHDPLESAFKMSAKLEALAELEPEYKEEYLKLRVQCQTFATKLLDYTRTSKELETLLDFNGHQVSMSSGAGDDDDEQDDERDDGDKIHDELPTTNCIYAMLGRRSKPRLARLKLAIRCKQKAFCAHPNIQELLATMWYENLPGFRRMSIAKQALHVICIGFMFPIYSLAYLLAPKSQFGQHIKKPFVKFICHSASYITFITFLILASQRVEAFYSWSSIASLFLAQPNKHQEHLFASVVEGNFSLFKQTISGPPPLPSSSYSDDLELNQLAAIYKHTMSQAELEGSRGLSDESGGSTARGLDSLSKIFEQLPASSKKRGTLPSPIESVILVWVISLIWAEMKQIRALGINYYKHDMWNLLDSVASGCYIGTIILRLLSYMQSDEKSMEVAREHWNAYDPTLLSEGLFATATIFSSLKLVYIFSVNPYLGPLQISLGRMIIDILRFSWIYMLVLFAFACGMNQLLWYYADLERHQCLNVTNYNLAQYYRAKHNLRMASAGEAPAIPQTILGVEPTNSTTGAMPRVAPVVSPVLLAPNGTEVTNATDPIILTQNGELMANITDDNLMESAFSASLEDDDTKPPVTIDDSCKTWRHFSNVFESSQTLFWANFGLVDLENFDLTGIRQYTRFWALLMFGCYCFINVIVVLNLLIAMMNHSYVKISTRSDIEWKFARTRLWMTYFENGSTVPAPFNMVPSIKSTRYFMRRARRRLAGWYKSCCSCVNRAQSRTQKVRPTADDNNNNQLKGHLRAKIEMAQLAEDLKTNCNLARVVGQPPPLAMRRRAQVNYDSVIKALVRRYLVDAQRQAEKDSALTEAKLKRWARLNVFT